MGFSYTFLEEALEKQNDELLKQAERATTEDEVPSVDEVKIRERWRLIPRYRQLWRAFPACAAIPDERTLNRQPPMRVSGLTSLSLRGSAINLWSILVLRATGG